MTTQEAIDILVGVIATNSEEENEALDMAIKALSSSEPKTADSGSVDSEMPEVKTDRTTGDLISRQDAIDALWEKRQALNDYMEILLQDDKMPLRYLAKIERNRIEEDINIIEELPSATQETFEWCHDCKEYDQDQHCCHRWSQQIRKTIEKLDANYPQEAKDELQYWKERAAKMERDYYITVIGARKYVPNIDLEEVEEDV